jgi:hypothetical protein
MPAPISLSRRIARKIPRTLKASGHWLRALVRGGRPGTRVVFVLGSQRSGTRLPLHIMDYSADIATFSEGTSPYFDRVMLQPLDYVAAHLRRSAAPIVVLKPICETHRVHELLDRFPGSKAIWIFRHYERASLSASVKWKSGREGLRRLAAGDLAAAAWRAGGLTEQKLAQVRRLYRDDMSPFEADVVMWYLRNGLYFDLGADKRSDVLLVRYEDLTSDPRRRFAEMFNFIGTPMPERAVNAIRESGGSRHTYPDIHPEIRSLCDELHNRLVTHYNQQTLAPGGAKVVQSTGTARVLASR